MKWLLLLGIVANVLGKVGADIEKWTNWANTFSPASVGALLGIISAALVSFVGGMMAQRNVIPPEVQSELDRLRKNNKDEI